jgi:CheY-like chemotaxis protein
MNGYEVAQKLRTAVDTRQIPIIAISSGAENNPVVSGLRSMSNASLPKPFSPDELLEVVNELGMTWQVTA